MNCIFCKIINKEIPASVIYEDDDVIAFLDLSQITKGHTLVLPKKHYDDLGTITNEDYTKVMLVVKKLSKAIIKAFDAKGCNIINNMGEIAGQTINHFHVHITPRFNKEELVFTHADNTGKFDLNEIKAKIINNLA